MHCTFITLYLACTHSRAAAFFTGLSFPVALFFNFVLFCAVCNNCTYNCTQYVEIYLLDLYVQFCNCDVIFFMLLLILLCDWTPPFILFNFIGVMDFLVLYF